MHKNRKKMNIDKIIIKTQNTKIKNKKDKSF